ncbi:hypothetical protein V2J09_011679 [Rumex salicifolius]
MLQSFQGSEKTVKVGPWGGQHGCQWDDGVIYSGIKQIVLTYGAGIDSIQIEYDKQGSSVWSEKHGGSGGYKTEKSNVNKYGPYGIEQGTFFSSSLNEHMIIGFYGRSGWYVDAIGAHMKPMIKNNLSKSMLHSNNFVATGSENYGYSVIQGQIGNNYDLVVAIKQKDNHPISPPVTYSKQISSSESDSSGSSSSDDEKKKHKIVALPPTKMKMCPENGGPVTYGPWGGKGGTVFDDGVYTGVRQIYLSRNMCIVYIKVLYDQNGLPVWGTRNGGTGGFKTDKVLTHITGYYGPAMVYGPNTVQSLTFHTTKGKHGPYGEEQGTAFSTNLKEGRIVGFHGRRGLFVDAIGVHVAEGKVTPPTRPPSKSLSNGDGVASDSENNPMWHTKSSTAIVKHSTTNRPQFEEIPYGVVKEPAPCGPGPWGGDGGKPWDDGVYTGIRQIFLTRSEGLCSIQIEYDRNGQSVWSIKHGGNSGTITHRIKLEYPHEVLTCVSGYYGSTSKDDHTKVIRSLTFYTSRGKFGPFGEEIGTFFTSTKTQGKVVGFHGRSGMYMDAIGVHMQHWLGGIRQSKTSSLFKMFG